MVNRHSPRAPKLWFAWGAHVSRGLLAITLVLQLTAADSANDTDAGVAAFLAKPAHVSAEPVSRAGTLTWSPAILDFGAIAWNAEPHLPVLLTNTGPRRIHVQAMPDCGCTRMSGSTLDLEPGASQSVTVTLHPAEMSGVIRKGISYQVYDDATLVREVQTITATVDALVAVSPRVVDFGRLPVGPSGEVRTVTITSLRGELRLNGFRGSPQVACSVETIEPLRRYTVTIRAETINQGPRFDEIWIQSATPGIPDIRLMVTRDGIAPAASPTGNAP